MGRAIGTGRFVTACIDSSPLGNLSTPGFRVLRRGEVPQTTSYRPDR
jgi:hypothetical protein